MTINALVGQQALQEKEVLASDAHPSIVRSLPLKPDNGTLDAGLLLARGGSGLVPYQNAAAQSLGTGDGATTGFSGMAAIAPLNPGSVVVSDGTQVLMDDGHGTLYGDGSGTVNHVTGAVAATFAAAPVNGVDIAMTAAGHLVGVLLRGTDTAQETVGRVVRHGVVVQAALTVAGGGAPTQADLERLAGLGIFSN